MRNRHAQRLLLCVALWISEGRASADRAALPECESDAACLSLYDRAKDESSRGNLHESLRLYMLAYEVRADPRLLFTIARVLHKLEKNPEAASYYRQFIDSRFEDAELQRKAQQYLERVDSVAPLPAPLPVKVSTVPEPPSKHAPAKRPRWRLIVGGVAIGTGLVLTGFGGSALAAKGKCIETPIPPAQTCDIIFATNPIGGALLGTGAAVVVGGVVLMAWPGR